MTSGVKMFDFFTKPIKDLEKGQLTTRKPVPNTMKSNQVFIIYIPNTTKFNITQCIIFDIVCCLFFNDKSLWFKIYIIFYRTFNFNFSSNRNTVFVFICVKFVGCRYLGCTLGHFNVYKLYKNNII